jgi:hypothetical protein
MVFNFDIYEFYTADQLASLKKHGWEYGDLRETKGKSTLLAHHRINHTLKITYNKNFSTNIDPQLLMKKQQNKFLNWDCAIGGSNMRVDHDVIYRGVCEVGGERHLDDAVIEFTNDYIPCTSPQCFCGTDMVAPKILPKHLYPSD